MLNKEFEDVCNNNIVIQPKIDIICLKMLQIIGFNPEPVTFNVRRKLFGCCSDSNGQSISDSLAEQATEYAEQSSKIWNFDFVAESPLPAGRYAWEKVKDSDVPALYAASGYDDQSRCPSADQLLNTLDNSVCLRQSEDPEKDMVVNHTNLKSDTSQVDCRRCGQVSKRSQEKKLAVRCPKTRFVQTNIKAYTKVQKSNRISKRTNLNRKAVKCLTKSLQFVNYILPDQEESSRS